jgi:hypothetical protein
MLINFPSRYRIRHGARRGCTWHDDAGPAVPPARATCRRARSREPVAGWRGRTRMPTPKAIATCKGSAIFLLLAYRPVVEDRPADAFAETGRGHDQLPIGAPGFLCLGNIQPAQSFVACWNTFIHRQQALIAGDQLVRGVYQLLRIHLGLFHFQFWISGMSTPCLSIYRLCSTSLSANCCLR